MSGMSFSNIPSSLEEKEESPVGLDIIGIVEAAMLPPPSPRIIPLSFRAPNSADKIQSLTKRYIPIKTKAPQRPSVFHYSGERIDPSKPIRMYYK